jgi:hypothetical protein
VESIMEMASKVEEQLKEPEVKPKEPIEAK